MPPRHRTAAAANGRVAAAATAHTEHEQNGKDKPAASEKLTLTWDELPAWMQDNHYVLSGYRRELRDVKACIYSIFTYLHNESVNIHTHMWAALTFIVLLFTVHIPLSQHAETVIWVDYVGFVIFLLSAIFCLGCSTTFHTLQCHSKEVSKRCHILDYIGIVVLTVGSYYPTVYYGFFCDPWPQIGYTIAITIAGGFAMYVVLEPMYATPAYRWARTSVFLALGLCSIVPVTHAIWASGYHMSRHEMGLDWLLASGALYVAGALIYAGRVPERLAPGKFDIFFTSHQIFHCCVVGAALCEYVCVVVALNHRHGVGGGTCAVKEL